MKKIITYLIVFLLLCLPLSLAQTCQNFNKKGEYIINNVPCQVGIRQNNNNTDYLIVLDQNCNIVTSGSRDYFELYFVDKISELVLNSPENLNTVEDFKNFFIKLKTIYSGVKTSNQLAAPYLQYTDEILPYIKATGQIVSSLSVVISWNELYKTSIEIKKDGLINENEVEIFKEKLGSFALNGIAVFVSFSKQGAKRAVIVFLQLSPNIDKTQVDGIVANWEGRIKDYPMVNEIYMITSIAVSKIIEKSPKVVGAIFISTPAVALEKEMDSNIAYQKGLIPYIPDNKKE